MNKQIKHKLHLWLLVAIVVLASIPLYVQKSAGCMVRNITGIHCPGCGGKRALTQLSDGNFLSSLKCNLLLIPAVLFIAWILCSYLPKQKVRQVRITKRMSLSLLVIISLYTVVRNMEAMSMLRP